MTRHIHQQWRDEQEGGKFPFIASASLRSRTGIAIAADTFLDAHLYPIGGGEGLHIPQVDVFADRVKLYVGTETSKLLCFAEFDPLSPPTMLALTDSYGRPAGVLICSDIGLAVAQSWDQGTHTFTREATEFVATVCSPTPEIGVRGIITDDGDVLTGDIWIVGENGIVVREDPDIDVPGGAVLRVDIVGDPLFRRALCDAEVETPSGNIPLLAVRNYLKTINHISPDQYGNFTIQVGTAAASDPILRITPTAAGLLFVAVGQPTEKSSEN